MDRVPFGLCYATVDAGRIRPVQIIGGSEISLKNVKALLVPRENTSCGWFGVSRFYWPRGLSER